MILVLLSAALLLSAADVDANSVKLSVYYESLCPDSVYFIKFQMYPTWQLLTAQNLKIDFIPYGKATQTMTNSTYTFECQHGPEECQGNKEQACALDYLKDNSTIQVQFISCVMSTRNPPRAGSQCASVIGINFNPIQDCVDGKKGDELLAAMGDRTHSFTPKITFIPTVAINNVYNQTDQDEAMSNLLDVVCRHMKNPKPVACSG